MYVSLNTGLAGQNCQMKGVNQKKVGFGMSTDALTSTLVRFIKDLPRFTELNQIAPHLNELRRGGIKLKPEQVQQVIKALDEAPKETVLTGMLREMKL